MNAASNGPCVTPESVWALLESVTDPEIPVVNLREMGILRQVQATPSGFEVTLTPTYSGCPAMDQMVDDVQTALQNAGIAAQVSIQLAPAWSTDWMSPSALVKLRDYGIAPPHPRPTQVQPATSGNPQTNTQPIGFSRRRNTAPHEPIACPQCGAHNTTEISHFGSTACKALYRCLNCLEPFDYFKPY